MDPEDTEAPSTPINLSASNITATTTDLSWEASSDNVGVTGYNIYIVGSGMVSSVATTSTTITGLTPNTDYEMYVKAFDAAGNESSSSNTVNLTTLGGGAGCSDGVLSADSFETGWEGWSDGGGDDCTRVSNNRSYDGAFSIRLKDNSGIESSMTSSSYDLSQFSSVDVEFHFYPHSMESGEDFWLLYNDGSGWTNVASWVSGSEFNNGNFYTSTVTLDGGTYNLSNNAQFRFQCDASGNNDLIYVDLVTISGNCMEMLAEGASNVVIKELNAPLGYVNLDQGNDYETLIDAKLFPNPATDELTVAISQDIEIYSMRIFTLNGAEMKHQVLIDNFESIDVSRLVPGLYLMAIETEEGLIHKKFIKQ